MAKKTPEDTEAIAGRTLFAQKHLLHGDQVITRGKQLPEDFPADSAKLLEKAGDVAATPPAETKLTPGEAGTTA